MTPFLPLPAAAGDLLERPAPRHAVLGAGGVGLLIAAALARSGRDVVLLLREPTIDLFDGTIHLESTVLGTFDAPARAAGRLTEPVDVLWVATKATALAHALDLAQPEQSGVAVPLLNGVEHMQLLRHRFPRVVAASISVESERVAPGRVRQTSPFLRLALATGGDDVAAELRRAGLDVSIGASEASVLWSKMAFLVPLALTTTAADAPFGVVREEPAWRSRYERCRTEVCEVAAAEGAPQDLAQLVAFAAAAAADMRSSLQKDVAAGRPAELDAIGGAVVRAARRHGIRTTETEDLMAAIGARLTG